ncbi:TMX1 protein, partial [Polypterus senegalus]
MGLLQQRPSVTERSDGKTEASAVNSGLQREQMKRRKRVMLPEMMCGQRSSMPLLLIFTVLLSWPLLVEVKEHHIRVISDNNWKDILEGEWMIEFYAPWCPACQQLQKEWADFAEWGEDLDVNIAKVDVTEQPERHAQEQARLRNRLEAEQEADVEDDEEDEDDYKDRREILKNSDREEESDDKEMDWIKDRSETESIEDIDSKAERSPKVVRRRTAAHSGEQEEELPAEEEGS